MKTLTIKKTKKGNYIACINGIRGQQSESNLVHVFDSNFNFVNSINANPRFSWVKYCDYVCTIGAVDFNNIELISFHIEKCVQNNITGYITDYMIKSNNFKNLLSPIG